MSKHAERIARAGMRAAGVPDGKPTKDALRMAAFFEGMAREWAVIAREERAEANQTMAEYKAKAEDARRKSGGWAPPLRVIPPVVDLTPTPLQFVRKGIA